MEPEPLTAEEIEENCNVTESQAKDVLNYLVKEGWMLSKFIHIETGEDEHRTN